MAKSFVRPSNEQIQQIRDEFSVDDESIRISLNALQDWLEKQPHLPCSIDRQRLERFYINCKCSMEKTKKALDMYYSLRTKIPQVLRSRDPNSPEVQKAFEYCKFFPMPELTPDFNRILISTDLGSDPSAFNFDAYQKMIFMTTDVLLSEDYCLGQIYVFNWNTFSLGHLAALPLSAVKYMEIIARTAYCSRIKSVYIINAPGIIDKILNVLLPVISPKIAARVHAFPKGSEKIFEHIPREYFPSDLGGKGASVKELTDSWRQKMYDYRDWFLQQDHVHSDETKRPVEATPNDLFGVDGSFKKLSID